MTSGPELAEVVCILEPASALASFSLRVQATNAIRANARSIENSSNVDRSRLGYDAAGAIRITANLPHKRVAQGIEE